MVALVGVAVAELPERVTAERDQAPVPGRDQGVVVAHGDGDDLRARWQLDPQRLRVRARIGALPSWPCLLTPKLQRVPSVASTSVCPYSPVSTAATVAGSRIRERDPRGREHGRLERAELSLPVAAARPQLAFGVDDQDAAIRRLHLARPSDRLEDLGELVAVPALRRGDLGEAGLRRRVAPQVITWPSSRSAAEW